MAEKEIVRENININDKQSGPEVDIHIDLLKKGFQM